ALCIVITPDPCARRWQMVNDGGLLPIRRNFQYSRSPTAEVWARRGGDLRAFADSGFRSAEACFGVVDVSVRPKFEPARTVEPRREYRNTIGRLRVRRVANGGGGHRHYKCCDQSQFSHLSPSHLF